MVSAVVLPVLRAATVEDLDAIAEVMRVSVLDLFPAFFADERQTAFSAGVHIAHADPMPIADGTYFCLRRGRRNRCARRPEPPPRADCIPGTATTRMMIVFLDPTTEATTSERCSYARLTRRDWAGRFWKPAETPPAPRASSVSISAATLPGVPLYRAFDSKRSNRSC